MAAAELSPSELRAPVVVSAWARAYAAVWVVTLLAAAIVAGSGPAVRHEVRALLGLRLHAASNPPPSAERIGALALHNIPIACWPVLLGVFGAYRQRWSRLTCDVLVACWLVANTVPVGAALGSYGVRLACFVPQLPIEWGGLALGASGWILQRRRPLTCRRGIALATGCAGVMVAAAIVEAVGPPHA
jgi:hypothetical protein